MDDFANIIKLGALFVIGMTALVITYRCVSFIYRLTTCTPQPPVADAKPVPDASNVTPIDAVTWDRRVRTGT